MQTDERPADTVICCAVDITEEKLLEQALDEKDRIHRSLLKDFRLSTDLWESTFNSIPDPLSVQDADYTLLRVNKAYADFVRSKPEDLIGKMLFPHPRYVRSVE